MKTPKSPLRLEAGEWERYGFFLESILTSPAAELEKNYSILCEAWKNACDAVWVWLFLLDNSLGTPDVLQLVAISKNAPLPDQVRVENSANIAAYCAQKGVIEIVDFAHAADWQTEYRDKIYTIGIHDCLRDAGCTRFLCVPLLFEGREAYDKRLSHPTVRGVVCVHYTTPTSQIPEFRHEALSMMGKLSAQAILNSYQALQRDILLELNQIAHKHLTSGRRSPREACKYYVSDVINVIRRYLQSDAVSIFYRDSLRGGVQCLDSTGLLRLDQHGPVPIDDISGVNYQPGEGRTGECYRSGIPLFLNNNVELRHKPKTFENTHSKSDHGYPAIIYPIPLAIGIESDKSGNKALGVIRCADHYSSFSRKTELCLDPIGVQTLDFIARQIAPILETFETIISRERTVSVTKHDLLAPLDMIRHKAFNPRLASGSDPNDDYVSINRYDIYDIGICALLSLNLARQLDTDPTVIRDAVFDRVTIESRIIAPLKNVLAHYARKSNQMSIRYENFDLIPPLWLDEILIQRAFFNLILNAIKYGEKRTEIRIEGRRTQNGFTIDIINEGVGVNAEEEQSIFQPGYRSPRVRHMRIGLGLGLPVARACIEQCGGSLFLQARKNPTVFSVFFPAELAKKSNHSK